MVEYEQYRIALNSMKDDVDELGKALNVEGAERDADDLQKETMAADFYSDMEKSGRVLKKLKQVKGVIEHFEKIKAEREDLLTMIEKDLKLSEKLSTTRSSRRFSPGLTTKTTPS